MGQHLDHCENANHDLSRKLFAGFNDVDTKFSELTIDDMFVKMLQQGGGEYMRSDLEEF